MWLTAAWASATDTVRRVPTVVDGAHEVVEQARRGLDLVVTPLAIFVWLAVAIVVRDLLLGDGSHNDIASQAVWKCFEAVMYVIATAAFQPLVPRLPGVKLHVQDCITAAAASAFGGREWVFVPEISVMEVEDGEWLLTARVSEVHRPARLEQAAQLPGRAPCVLQVPSAVHSRHGSIDAVRTYVLARARAAKKDAYRSTRWSWPLR